MTSGGRPLLKLRDKLRLAQVLLALLAALVSAVPDLRGFHGLRVGEVELFQPAEGRQIEETATPLARTGEDVEEFFGNDAPAAHIRGVRLALTSGAHLRRCQQSWTPSSRLGCAHPATGPPTV